MAEDFLCLALYNMEKGNLQLPPPTDIKNVPAEPDDIVTLISVDTETYRTSVE